ncbi:MAG TPA: T9SS type A sorting domain-containing protein, partial [Cytophagaceae bacterium]
TVVPIINLNGYGSYAENVAPGSKAIIYEIPMNSEETSFQLNSLTLTTKGNYQLPDIGAGGFKLWYYDGNTGEKIELKSVAAVASGSDIVFSGIDKTFEQGEYYSLFISVDIASNATLGNTIGLEALKISNIIFDQQYGFPTWSSFQEGNLITVAIPSITIGSKSTPASSVSPGSVSNVVYILKIKTTNSSASFNQLTFKTSGTFQASDINSFKLYVGDDQGIEDFAGSATPVTSGDDVVFNFDDATLDEDDERYLYLTVDFSNTAVIGRTLRIEPVTPSNIIATAGTITGTTTAGGINTITETSVTFSPVGPAAGTESPGTLLLLHTVKVDVTGANATFNGADFTLNGTYQVEDIDSEEGFYLVYHYTPNIYDELNSEDIRILSNIDNTPISGGTLSFPNFQYDPDNGFSPTIPVGTGYISVVASISSTATVGNTLQLNTSGISSYTLASGTKSGTTGNGGVQTIGAPTITISNVAVQASNVSPGTKQIVYAFKADVADASAILKELTLTTAGTYQDGDIWSFTLYMSNDDISTFNINNPQIGNEYVGWTSSVPTGGTLQFDYLDFEQIIPGTKYFYVIAEISPSATIGNTISLVGPASSSAFSFISGNVNGTFPMPASGIQTITKPTSINVTYPALSGTNLTAGTKNNVIYQFNVTSTGANAVLGYVDLITDGTYTIDDINYFGIKFWYNTTNSFSGSFLLEDKNAVPSNSSISFSGNNTSIPAGSTVYFFVTVDLNSTATPGHTISIKDVEYIHFYSGTPTGTPNTGSEFTIVSDVTGLFSNTFTNDAVIYPNPSKAMDIVKINTSSNSSKKVHIYTASGILLSTYEMTGNELTLENMEKGMYMITIQNNDTNQIETKKLIVE